MIGPWAISNDPRIAEAEIDRVFPVEHDEYCWIACPHATPPEHPLATTLRADDGALD